MEIAHHSRQKRYLRILQFLPCLEKTEERREFDEAVEEDEERQVDVHPPRKAEVALVLPQRQYIRKPGMEDVVVEENESGKRKVKQQHPSVDEEDAPKRSLVCVQGPCAVRTRAHAPAGKIVHGNNLRYPIPITTQIYK